MKDDINESLWQILWAKSDPYHSLWHHLLDIAAVAEQLAPRFGPWEGVPLTWICLLVALHDIGKADAAFVGKAPELNEKGQLEGLLPADLADCKGFRHEARSAEWVQHYLKECEWDKYVAQTVAAAIRGHHGDFNADCYDEDFYPLRQALYEPLRSELVECVVQTLGVKPFIIGRLTDASAFGTRLAGLIVLSDWIASGDNVYHYPSLNETCPGTDAATYYEAAREEATRALTRLELNQSPLAPAWRNGEPLAFNTIWPGFTPRGVQKVLEEKCLSAQGLPPGLLIIEAPMGEGKTEAAVYVAQEWSRQRHALIGEGRGTYIALPTQATSNQLHERYQKFLTEGYAEGSAPHLVHGMAWLIDRTPQVRAQTFEDTNEAPASQERMRGWFAPAKRALLAPEAVGTVDQVLMAALNVKHGFLRLFGLSAKTLVIDEVHAYDDYMTTLMERLLMWCRALDVPVILLSATLSREQKETLLKAWGTQPPTPSPDDKHEPYPLVTFAPFDNTTPQLVECKAADERSVSLTVHHGLLNDPVAIAALAVEQVKNGGCECVLMNSVRQAQDVFRALDALRKDGKCDADLLLFHARFPAARRDEIEKKIVRLFGKPDRANPLPRLAKAILVATQVVEQSLDVDFDVMLTQIAPLDLILQRSGRLHRHLRTAPNIEGYGRGGHTTPHLHVLLPPEGSLDFGATGRVYKADPLALLRTLALLQDKIEIVLPDEFRPLIENVYGSKSPADALLPAAAIAEATAKKRHIRADAQNKARTHLIAETRLDEFRYAQAEDPVDEAEEGERANYFRAQTRLGDDSRATLVLTPRLMKLLRRAQADVEARQQAGKRNPFPHKAVLRTLFRQKVNLPVWWLTQLVPDEGFTPLMDREIPRWLKNHVVIEMQDNGYWQGAVRTDKGEQPVILRNDPLLGLCRETFAAEATMDVGV